MTRESFVRRLSEPTTVLEVARALTSCTVEGGDRPIAGIGSLGNAEPDVLAFCDAPRSADVLAATQASVVILAKDVTARPRANQTYLRVDDVRSAFIDIVDALLPGSQRPQDPRPGVDASARIAATASIAGSASIGANVEVGARSRVGPGTVIYDDTVIGVDCVIGANAVIGWVGLAYHDRRDGTRSFFPHLAGVRIGNRVDVGAQTCVCRGMLSHTFIDDDAKIGSLVYVSHGVVIGHRAWLSAGTAVAGHASVEHDALLGIGSVVIDNVKIEAGVLVGGGSVVTKNAQEGSKLYGVPAHPVPSMRRFGPTPRE
jgi:UDP-3-O-[3-hydroxymyristoyl] glucosamine N-acyltransferase